MHGEYKYPTRTKNLRYRTLNLSYEKKTQIKMTLSTTKLTSHLCSKIQKRLIDDTHFQIKQETLNFI